jgi:hypothetical protein
VLAAADGCTSSDLNAGAPACHYGAVDSSSDPGETAHIYRAANDRRATDIEARARFADDVADDGSVDPDVGAPLYCERASDQRVNLAIVVERTARTDARPKLFHPLRLGPEADALAWTEVPAEIYE